MADAALFLGYGLVIGVDGSADGDPKASGSAAARKIAETLIDPRASRYAPDRVTVLTGHISTVLRIVNALQTMGKKKGLCLLLAEREPGAMETSTFVGSLAPALLQQLRRAIRVEREVGHGRARGRVDWSATYKERYATDGNPAVFVCLPGWRQFDLPENQLVKATLLSLQRAVAAVPHEMGTLRASGRGAPRRDGGGSPDTVAALLERLRYQLRKLLGMMALREVTEPAEVDNRHLVAARGSKYEMYGLVADFHEYLEDVEGGRSWDRWARAVRAALPLLLDDPTCTRVGALADPRHGRAMSETRLRANGILADTGGYGLETTVQKAYNAILAERGSRTPAEVKVEAAANTLGTQDLAAPRNLEETRWAIIIPDPVTPAALANKPGLVGRLAANPPAPLFTATHGIERKAESALQQRADQGALLMQEWPGPNNPALPAHFLAGADFPTSLTGMLAFCFACYSAGAPRPPDWIHPSTNANPSPVAASAFVANLPQKMLARGALAFIGHVSNAWDCSFLSAAKIDGAYRQTLSSCKSLVSSLLRGFPAGHETDSLNGRWLILNQLLDSDLAAGAPQGDKVGHWIARNDCRGYVVLGDPAARLNI